jgi:hypothetical protein
MLQGGSLIAPTGVEDWCVGWDVDLARKEHGREAEFHAWLALPCKGGRSAVIFDPSTRYLPDLAAALGMPWAREIKPCAWGELSVLYASGYHYRADSAATMSVDSAIRSEWEVVVKANGMMPMLKMWAQARLAGRPFHVTVGEW